MLSETVIAILHHGSALSVLPFWIPMIVAPHTAFTKWWVKPVWIILPPVVCYTALVLPNLLEFGVVFADASPAGLAAVMGETWASSAFWAYAGAFDLFVGRWMFFDAHARGIRFVFLAPILTICIASGPLAFLLYAAVVALHSSPDSREP